MSPGERAQVIDSLPEDEVERQLAPEGTLHWTVQVDAWQTLRAFFDRTGRRMFLAADLATYYPGEPSFAPDLLAVVDVESGHRTKWVVLAEGKGLDWVMEMLVLGERRKDLERNVEWYARLGIPECFVYDRGRQALVGWRLPRAARGCYERIVPYAGRVASEVLGLDLLIEEGRLRFYQGTAPLLEARKLTARLERMVEEQAERAEAEARRAAEAERRSAELLAEIERLKRGGR